MSNLLDRSALGKTVLLFGPQALSFDENAFRGLRSTLLGTEAHRWILDAIADLPECLECIFRAFPKLTAGSQRRSLDELITWFDTGEITKKPFVLPNLLLNPLVIITQLTEYAKYLELRNEELGEISDAYSYSKHDTETIGLCTGFLSALAVSCSENEEQFQKYGAAALRIGMLIGLVVDAKEESVETGTSKSFAVSWNNDGSRKEATQILENFPEAYISVLYDENRATVTTSARTASTLQQQLSAAGIIASEVNIRGRFHWEHHSENLDVLIAFCDSNEKFKLPDASALVIPCRSACQGDFISQGQLHHEALRSILIEVSKWYQIISAAHTSSLKEKDSLVISFGPERCVPPSIMRRSTSQVVQFADLNRRSTRMTGVEERPYSENDIAVIGMSCKVAGADGLEEFWELLCEGKSQHKEVPKERFEFDTAFRDDNPNRKWYGNFINDHDKFDHKFFKKSPREISSTDPQQRHLLQIAYQAVEQSGYFCSRNPDKRVGCYVGVCAVDYESNIACHAPNAFSATGNLRGFIAGKVSHFFGWTGPGLTIDTACSSSAVAVHQACKAILGGECNAALAAGTHVITNPLWYQNLAGASFLSPSGSCKPFDAKADGYCRGEAVAAVFLKKMSAAIADGDQILGTIASTVVQQNQNCTPIVVPNAPSLSDLFLTVLRQARIKPDQITVVEAHGTGTPVGDPAEYDSIRQVLGGPNRSDDLILSSVKGLIGHTECTSGLVSLIKTLLMIQNGAIPPQASFDVLNPAIRASHRDHIKIPTILQPWNADFRAALINNYGASGSNASLIVTQAPRKMVGIDRSNVLPAKNAKYPFWICGIDDRAIRAYSSAIRTYLVQNVEAKRYVSLSNMSFNMSRQSNRTLDRGLIFSCRSLNELDETLGSYERRDQKEFSTTLPALQPVVLCFGGQVSTFVGLEHQVYEGVKIFRTYIDQCNLACLSQGIESLFPGIFQRSPIEDPVKLQTMLFAVQYACAKTWMACGVEPTVLLGHSFGELTALCVSGVLTLEDTLEMIVRRATIIRDYWGPEKGAMLAIEADLIDVQRILKEANLACKDSAPVTIACFNGPRSFTIAGSTQAVNAVVQTISKDSASGSIRSKRLNVSNAFHSPLVDPLMTQLEESGRDLNFRKPEINFERATEFGNETKFTAKFVASHMREPVYFDHSVRRIAKRYPSCIWLEAGSQSTITAIASRALAAPRGSHFQAVNLTSDNAVDNLTETILSLWKAGLRVTFWAHHNWQAVNHTPLLLPPYQFEKVAHWLELKKPLKLAIDPAVNAESQKMKMPESLLTFDGYQDSQSLCARFRINTMIPKYDRLVSGHIVAETAPICPATVQIDLAIEGIRSLHPEIAISKLQPQIHSVDNQSPICVDPARSLFLELKVLNRELNNWSFKIHSTNSHKSSVNTVHTTGKIVFHSPDEEQVHLEFARYERIVGHQSCVAILNSPTADDIIQGRNIYRIFSEIVNYGEDYRGLQKLVGQGQISAGRVVKKYNRDTWLDAHLADAFCQVGGIWVNCMTDRHSTDMYIANGIEQWTRSPKFRSEDVRPEIWDVMAFHHSPSDNAFLTDIFIFNPETSELLEIIQGIKYVKVSKVSMTRLLSRLTTGEAKSSRCGVAPSTAAHIEEPATGSMLLPPSHAPDISNTPTRKKLGETSSTLEISGKIKAILAELSGLELENINNDTELANIGIDSLMGMEMTREIEIRLKCTLNADKVIDILDVQSLLRCVQEVLGFDDAASQTSSGDNESFNNDKQLSEFFSDTGTGSATSVTSVVETDSSSYLAELNVGELKAEVNQLATTNILDCAAKEHSNHLERSVSIAHIDPGPTLPPLTVLEAFREIKLRTDQVIEEYQCSDYVKAVMPTQTQLCTALILEAFEQLGCFVRSAKAGQELLRVPHTSEHSRFVDYLYQMLQKEARLIDIDGPRIIRTAMSDSTRSSKDILQDLLKSFPEHDSANNLTYYAGSHLAEVLSGKMDGIKLIFASAEGRKLVSELYGDWPINRLFYKQMEDFFARLVSKLPMHQNPLKILEMGAGTGGTTKWLVPLLASLKVPIEYTFTDIGPSFVAAARKKFHDYPFMKFRTHDIEKVPNSDLLGTQHVIIASNAVHATHSLTESAANIRKALRPDGFLLMLEMTGTLHWVDMIFGNFEGWWLFDDGRTHAVSNESRWEKDLQSVGYGHVDWTDGLHAENKIEKVIIAMASRMKYDRIQGPSGPVMDQSTDFLTRKAAVEEYVRMKTNDFVGPIPATESISPCPPGQVVLITGATGSVGSHLIASLLVLPSVRTIICLNRKSTQDPMARQKQALISKGIFIPGDCLARIKVFESDMTKPMLGLPEKVYEDLRRTVTHVIHNAWLMNAKLRLKGFESQFHIMRNMIDLARDISCSHLAGLKVTFQFVSSIACVGHFPLWKKQKHVPEERMPIDAVLPNGYGDAKYVCELMLDETLHKYPEHFHTMSIRIGQIAGSKTSGYWNPMEHLSFLWKSSQTINALPDFEGLLSWTPVDDVASTLVDLLQVNNPYPIYHIDNPVRQSWSEMIPILADALDIPRANAIPFHTWIERVRNSPNEENPALKLIDFLDEHFIRMSCGGLLLETVKSREHSETLRAVGPVSDEVTRRFVQSWKDMRFLS